MPHSWASRAGGSESRQSGDGMHQSSLTSSWKPWVQRNFREQFTHFSWGVGGLQSVRWSLEGGPKPIFLAAG